jgi:DNA (cytosine-5)-methyltransferase 1
MKLLDLFSGIGGFHKGFERAGFKFDWVGHSDIDKYANSVYQYNFKAEELGDVTTIQPRDLPDNIDILTGGFPCQAFSTAGKRRGFADTRGTLFFQIERILRHFRDIGKPIPYFVLENVKGLLNHNSRQTFATIYGVLTNLDYTIECQLLNTKWFLPQNRERIYIVGHLRDRRSGPKIFPIRQNNKKNKNNKSKVYTNTISIINKKGNLKNNQDYASCLSGGGNSGGNHSEMDLIVHSTQPRSGDPTKGGTGPLSRKDGNTYCLDTGNTQAVKLKSSIRRLTPLECERLQGFPDNWTSKGMMDGEVVDISNTQRYKQCGNAVSVPVVQAVAEKVKALIET